MENILKIIYDKSIDNKVLSTYDIDKILDLLIIDKNLNNYILNMDVQPIGSNKLASYCNYTKIITIYSNVIENMLCNIERKIKINNQFEIMLYKNLSILQVILHEVEHANQEKIAYSRNNLEAFLIRLSRIVKDNPKLYSYSIEERLAEIKSFEEILLITSYIKNKSLKVDDILNGDKLQRLLNGYHYKNSIIEAPTITYFNLGNKKYLLDAFDWYSNDPNRTLDNVLNIYEINERLKYGLPISVGEYCDSMRKLIKQTNKNFKNKILITK